MSAVIIWLACGIVPVYAESADRVAAVVGNEVILKSDIDERELMTRMQYPETKNDPRLRQQLLQAMVDQKVLLTKAKIDSVTVDERALEAMSSDRFTELRSRFGSVSEMEARFGRRVGKIRQDIREELKNQQLVDALKRKKIRDVTVSYDETVSFFRELKDRLPDVPEAVAVSQIIMFPVVSDDAKAEALAKIRMVQEKLKEGGDFAALARKWSSDPGSAQLGGDLGFVQKGEFIRGFEDASFALNPGQVSDVVETRFGYHIIQLIDKEENSIHVRHILAAFDRNKTDTEKTLRQLRSIRVDIVSGKATFAAMAARYSEDPSSAKVGGMIQPGGAGKKLFAPSSLRPELQKIIAGLKHPGQVSQPEILDSQKGEKFFGLFQLDSRIAPHKLGLEEDFARIEELAMENRRTQLFKAWMDELKKDVLIKLSDI